MFGVVLGLFGILRLVLDYSRHPSLGGRSVVYHSWLVSLIYYLFSYSSGYASSLSVMW